jgi:type III restriction enzyme
VKDVVIKNPILNTPFKEPGRYFRFDDDGITGDIIEGRRPSSFFIPVPSVKKWGKKQHQEQLAFDTEWTHDRILQNEKINQIRERVSLWRQGGYVHVTRTTRRLLDYWRNPDRERRLFFCQLEAAETAVYVTEVARKVGDQWVENWLAEVNHDANPLLNRTAFKMATGSGKTVLMAMLIAWHALNKRANRQDVRFSDAFLLVTPGITIRDRLRVLLPEEPENYYREMDIVPPDLFQELLQAKIVITNFHAFMARDLSGASRLAKGILKSNLTETPGQVVKRVCRDLGNKRGITVINDEAHHCYRRRAEDPNAPVVQGFSPSAPPTASKGPIPPSLPLDPIEKLKGEDKKEADRRNEEARVWITGVEWVKEKVGARAVYDVSATPFFLRGSGYQEGTLFPWVVSDFSLIDAIESGIVKVPRVPVADDQMREKMPIYRNLWVHIRADLPKKGRATEKLPPEPHLPKELEGAIQSLYGDYKKRYDSWAKTVTADSLSTPPVFIVVCNNTNVSRLVFNYVAGYDKELEDGSIHPVPGQLDLFSNVANDRWLAPPNTILVDSVQLDSGEAMSPEFKRASATLIAEFKEEYRRRYSGRDPEDITDEELMREVLNTVGKPGRMGAAIKCVVSVSMLTEGWDANTVTHILGVRAFGTQLLCEQVVGRGLRRTSYVPMADGMFPVEYAEVYGVPFSFIPSTGEGVGGDQQQRKGSRVRALEDRAESEITFPRVLGYRQDIPEGRLEARFDQSSRMVLSARDLPLTVENAPIFGEGNVLTMEELKAHREQEVVFRLAKYVQERFFRDDQSHLQIWAFPQLLRIVREWTQRCVDLEDDAFPQLLLLTENTSNAADRINNAITRAQRGPAVLKPILQPYDTLGSTRYVAFDTLKATYPTNEKCHVNFVTLDSDWEAKLASTLEGMDEVEAYVKNQGLMFNIPYSIDGKERAYYPDFIVRVRGGSRFEVQGSTAERSPAQPETRGSQPETLNLILEVTGEKKVDKQVKVATARTLWVPAINNHGGFGRWAFLEIDNPWNAKSAIRAFLTSLHDGEKAA